MNGNERKPCDCKSEYQDSKYGKGVRIHTVGKEGKSFICTVCGKKK